MNAQTFVSALIEVVERGAVRGVRKDLEKPPGRQPPADLVGRSRWYLGLSESDRLLVDEVMNEVASQTVYNVCLLLDGLVDVEAGADKGSFRLVYSKHGVESEIARTDGSDLSGEYKSQHP